MSTESKSSGTAHESLTAGAGESGARTAKLATTISLMVSIRMLTKSARKRLSKQSSGVRANSSGIAAARSPGTEIPAIIFLTKTSNRNGGPMNRSRDEPIPAAPIQRIFSAAQFAAEKHAAHKRKGVAQEPYINHLIEVAQLIADSSDVLDTNLVMAGLLHDTLEDTGTKVEEIDRVFGRDIASLVAEVTDDKSLPKEVRKALQVKNAPHKSVRAQVIKLADKIANLRSILASPPTDWSIERKRNYFEWAKQVVDGLSAPNSLLKAEFDRTYAKFDDLA